MRSASTQSQYIHFPVVAVVDGDPKNRADIVRFFPYVNRVLEAGTGHDGLLLAEHKSVEIVLVSCILPDMCGREFVKLLYASRPSIGTIIMSPCGEGESVITAMESGARGYLIRPTTPDRVMSNIFRVWQDKLREKAACLRISKRVKQDALASICEDEAKALAFLEATSVLKRSLFTGSSGGRSLPRPSPLIESLDRPKYEVQSSVIKLDRRFNNRRK